MTMLSKLTPRQILIVLHDLLATVAAIMLTFLVRFEGAALYERTGGLKAFLPFFVLYAAVVYFVFDLHRNKWRFTSVPDLNNIVRASTVLASTTPSRRTQEPRACNILATGTGSSTGRP